MVDYRKNFFLHFLKFDLFTYSQGHRDTIGNDKMKKATKDKKPSTFRSQVQRIYLRDLRASSVE